MKSKDRAKRIAGRPVLFMLAASLLFVSACAAQQTESSAAAQNEQPVYEWSIQVKSSRTAGDLSATNSVQQYDGGITREKVQSQPGEGNLYLLLELSVEKQASGAANFDWQNLFVQDAAGSRYQRMENDTFLESFGYGRIKSTDLTLGKNEGYACFEITKESAAGELDLVYEDPQGENRIKIQ